MLHAARADRGAPSGVPAAPAAPGVLVPTPPLSDDAALLARMATHDGGAALGALFDRHGRQAFAVAYGMTGSAEVAEEVVQDAFLAVWRRAEQYAAARGTVRGWLLAIVRNRALDHLRARQARPQRAAGLQDFAALAGTHDTEGTALQLLEAASMRAAVATLPSAQRQTVELAYFAGLSYPEVAATTGAPLGTVKSRMRLALTSLRGALGPPATD